VFVSRKPLNRLPLLQAIISMAGALLVITTFLLVRRDYQGSDSLYGAGAFTDVVGAILLMAGSLLIHLMSGHRRKPTSTGFGALAERSGQPTGRKEWKPPESSVKAPTCPSCGEELRPGWKACPNCGYALLSDRSEEHTSYPAPASRSLRRLASGREKDFLCTYAELVPEACIAFRTISRTSWSVLPSNTCLATMWPKRTLLARVTSVKRGA
jgi:hypothetical protein